MGQQASLLDPEMIRHVRETGRLSDLAYTAILDAITAGRIKPGEQIREQSITRELQVSRATVRSALHRLVVEGILVEEPFRGVRVLAMRPQDVREIFELRGLLEGHAMELAAARISREELARMRELLPGTVMTNEMDKVSAVRQRNQEFHWIAIRACGQELLIRHLELVWGVMATYVFLDQMTSSELRDVAEEDYAGHVAILEALEARDGPRACRALVSAVEVSLASILEHPPAPQPVAASAV